MTPSEQSDISRSATTSGSSELQAVLDALRSEGSLDSSGVFTVDLTKALPKLERFQLPEAHFGLLKVIQSAVVAGASRVALSFSAASIQVEHDGVPPKPHELRDLLNFLMAPDEPVHHRVLRDLGIGVNTALSRGGNWVEVGVLSGDEWVSQRWVTRGETEETAKPQSHKTNVTTRFTMQRSMGQIASRAWSAANTDIFDLLNKNRDAMDEDARTVYDRCRHAAADIILNGKRLPESSFGRAVYKRWSLFTLKEHRRPNLLEIYALCDEDSPHLITPPRASQSSLKLSVLGQMKDGRWYATGTPRVLDSSSEAAKRCFAVAGIRHQASTPGSATFIKDGVDLTTMSPPQLLRGVDALVSAEGLKFDLSHFRIVEGSEISERLNWIPSFVTTAISRSERSGLLGRLKDSEVAFLKSMLRR